LKLLATVPALVSRQSTPPTVFLCVTTGTKRAYFRPFLIVMLNIRDFSLYTSHHTVKSASQKFL